jgi:hypothetical protein
MKLTAAQLRRIIKEEVQKRKALNESSATPTSEAAKKALDNLRIEIETNLAAEGYEEEELEDLAASALTELFKEFMDGVGYGGRIDIPGL